MPWLQFKAHVKREFSDQFSDYLSENGAVAVTLQDAHDNPVFEPLPGETPLWPELIVVGLFEADLDCDRFLIALQQDSLWSQLTQTKFEQLEDKDWEKEWMDNFHPIHFGGDLWICPSWLETPDPNATNILLDPGVAFGTGTHPTTFLCMQWLGQADLANKTVIDFGCGSGILALAAVKRGASRVIGTDIDPQALEASRLNAERNDIGEQQLELFLPEAMPELQADVLVANILASPLKSLSKHLTQFVKPGGWIVLSGVLDSQADDVASHYSDDFKLEPIVEKEEWVRIVGQKL